MAKSRTNTGSYLLGCLLNEHTVAWFAMLAIVFVPLWAVLFS